MTDKKIVISANNLSAEELLFLAEQFHEIAQSLRNQSIVKASADATACRTREHLKRLSDSPRLVAQQVTSGLSPVDAITAIASQIEAQPEAVAILWRQACRKTSSFEAATRDRLIYRLIREGRSNAEIARVTGVHRSSIGRILARIKRLRLTAW